jgi:hypothetical protein
MRSGGSSRKAAGAGGARAQAVSCTRCSGRCGRTGCCWLIVQCGSSLQCSQQEVQHCCHACTGCGGRRHDGITRIGHRSCPIHPLFTAVPAPEDVEHPVGRRREAHVGARGGAGARRRQRRPGVGRRAEAVQIVDVGASFCGRRGTRA